MTANNASQFRKIINAEQYWVGKHRLEAGDVVNSSTVTGATVEDALDYISSSGVGPVLNLNGLTAATQTMTTGTAAGAGNDFNITTSGLSTHVFNMPSASATVRGVVTIGSQTFGGAKTFSNVVTLSAAPVLSTGTITVGAGTVTVPAVTDTLVGQATAATLTNKSLVDATTYIIDETFPTKIAQFDCSALTAGATKTFTFPDVSMTFVGQDNSQVLTTKTMAGATNIITARYLKTATTEVDVFTGAAPVLGQVLTATGGSAATWQTPASTVGTLTDVVISGTAEQDLLSWNAGTSKWNNRTVANALKGAGTTSVLIGSSSVAPGTDNVVIGTSAGSASMSTGCIAIGTDTLDSASGAIVDCIAIGRNCLTGALTTGANYSIGIGFNALNGLTSGARCTAIGYSAGFAVTSGNYNTFVGYNAGSSGALLNDRVCIGMNSLADGSGSVAVGSGAYAGLDNSVAIGYNINCQTNCVALGATAYAYGDNQICIGYGAKTRGTGSVSVGYTAGGSLSGGTSNTFIGYQGGLSVTTGADNTLVGYNAGSATITTGSNNTLVGSGTTLDAAARTGCVILGKGAASTADNQLVISTNNGANANTIRTTLACTAKGTSTGANPANTDYLTVSVNIGGSFVTRYIPLYTTA